MMEVLRSTSGLASQPQTAASPMLERRHQLDQVTQERDLLRDQLAQLQERNQSDMDALLEQVRVRPGFF